MKNDITKLEATPTSIKEIIKVLQELWNDVDLKEWRYLIERLIYKIKDVIECKGIATIY